MSLQSSNHSVWRLAMLAQACLVAVAGPAAKSPSVKAGDVYIARAYALQGVTADGSRVARGVVAADIRVLPLGTLIVLSGAGTYSGEYVVRDTGRLVQGRKLDVYVPTTAEAIKFGRRLVKVEVIGSIKVQTLATPKPAPMPSTTAARPNPTAGR